MANGMAVDSGEPDANQHVDSTEADEPLRLFRQVLEALQHDQISAFAMETRQNLEQHNSDKFDASFNSAMALSPPLTGSYNVLIPILFDDNVRWLLRIPGTGTVATWDTHAANSLRSEALVMRKLRHEMRVAIPKVFHFEDYCENCLKVPFILMEFVEGKSLFDLWFDYSVPKDIVRSRRVRALQDIADAMMKLSTYTFEKGGTILFNKSGQIDGIGPYRQVDNGAMYERLYTESEDETPIFTSYDPCTKTKDYFTHRVQCMPPPKADWASQDAAFLQKLVEWLPEAEENETDPFDLCHPDLNLQNILVSENGSLKAIIDWDGVAVVPKQIGSKRYPSWLTRDWDPAMYAWEDGMDENTVFEGCPEDSPETLQYYRGIYARFMNCLEKQKNATTPHIESSEEQQSESPIIVANTVTTRSIIFENLAYAIDDVICRHGILENLFNHIVRKIRPVDESTTPNYAVGRARSIDSEGSRNDKEDKKFEHAWRSKFGNENEDNLTTTTAVEEECADVAEEQQQEDDGDDQSADELSYWNVVSKIKNGTIDEDLLKKLKSAFEEVLSQFN